MQSGYKFTPVLLSTRRTEICSLSAPSSSSAAQSGRQSSSVGGPCQSSQAASLLCYQPFPLLLHKRFPPKECCVDSVISISRRVCQMQTSEPLGEWLHSNQIPCRFVSMTRCEKPYAACPVCFLVPQDTHPTGRSADTLHMLLTPARYLSLVFRADTHLPCIFHSFSYLYRIRKSPVYLSKLQSQIKRP